LLIGAVAAAALGGCGGPSEQEALGRWQSHADAICRQVEARVTERGRPTGVRDLDRLAVRAVQDVRGAMREIAAMPPPAGSEARVRPFVDAVRALAPRLEGLVAAGELADPTRMLVAVDNLQRPATELERHARRAGLRVCAGKGFADRVTDALVTPLFVDTVTETETGLVRNLRRANRLPRRSRFELAEYFRALESSLHVAKLGFGNTYPPVAAAEPLDDYAVLLAGGEELAFDVSSQINGGRPITRAWARQVIKRFRVLERRRSAAFARIFDALGTKTPPMPGSGQES
jgi:hypothetical protein